MSQYQFDLPEDKNDLTFPYTIAEYLTRFSTYGPDVEYSNKNCDLSLFPYTTKDPLPAPLPTEEAIAQAVSKSFTAAIGPYFVKIGTTVMIFREAENMLFLEKNTQVRIPKVYAAFKTKNLGFEADYRFSDKGTAYVLITEFINGMLLCDLQENFDDWMKSAVKADEDDGWKPDPEEAWDRRVVGPKTWAQKMKHSDIAMRVGSLLGSELECLRDVPPPPNCLFGRLNGRPMARQYPLNVPANNDRVPITWGPFTYEEFLVQLVHTSKAWLYLNHLPEGDLQFNDFTKYFYRNIKRYLLEHYGNGRSPMLAHLDLQPVNIMITFEYDDQGKPNRVDEVILIDWERMSWVPSWYEPALVYKLMRDEDVEESLRSVYEVAFNSMGFTNLPMTLFWGYGLACDVFR